MSFLRNGTSRNKKWRPYFAKDDWWAPFYPPDNFQRPTSALCDGCHSVNYDIKTKTVDGMERGVRKVPRAGERARRATGQRDHPESGAAGLCRGQRPLHSMPFAGPAAAQSDRGQILRLAGRISNLRHQLKRLLETRGSQARRDRLSRILPMEPRTRTGCRAMTSCRARCTRTGSVASPATTRMARRTPRCSESPRRTLCLDCHGPNSPSGPRAATLEQHTHHKAESAGSDCIACHMPKIAQTIANVNVRSHTFKFVSPAATEALKIPNACNACHTDKTTEWAAEALKSWSNQSPWRIAD